MDLLTLQMKANEADGLRVRLVEAKLELEKARALMLEMDGRYTGLKYAARYLDMKVKEREHWLQTVYLHWSFFLLPRHIKHSIAFLFEVAGEPGETNLTSYP